MNDKLNTLYVQLDQMSSDLQVMMTRVNDMQQAIALLTKEWLELTANDVMDEQTATAVAEPEPVREPELIDVVEVHDDTVEPDVIAIHDDELVADSADEIVADDESAEDEYEESADDLADADEVVDIMTAEDTVEFGDDIEIMDMDSDMPSDEADEVSRYEQEDEDMADPDVPFDFDDRFDPDYESEPEVDDDEPDEPMHDSGNTSGLPELRRLFTLNDKYRFRRELFGNDNAAMTDTVNMLEAMASLAEAEDYLYNDMGWDAESEEVKEFMAIVKRRFNAKL